MEYSCDIAISGMGPSALLAALYYVLGRGSKCKALLVSNRSPDFVRTQMVILGSSQRQELIDIYNKLSVAAAKHNALSDRMISTKEEDLKFLKSIQNHSGISIKEIERFLMRRLKEMQLIGYKIKLVNHSTFTSIDMVNGEATIEPISLSDEKEDKPDSIMKCKFKDFICADGAGRSALITAELSEDFNKKIKILPKSGPKNQHHMSAYIEINLNNAKISDKVDEFMIHSGNNRCALLINADTLEKNHYQKFKANFSGEVPDEIWSMKDGPEKQAALLNFVEENVELMLKKHIITEHASKESVISVSLAKESKKHGESKDRMRLTTFTTEITQADQASVLVSIDPVEFHQSGCMIATYEVTSGEIKEINECLAKNENIDKYINSIASIPAILIEKISDSESKNWVIGYSIETESFALKQLPDNIPVIAGTYARDENTYKAIQDVGIFFSLSRFFLLGDSLRTPNYQLGHGMNDAFMEARLFSERSLTTKKYNAECNKITDSTENLAKFIYHPIVPKKLVAWLFEKSAKVMPSPNTSLEEEKKSEPRV